MKTRILTATAIAASTLLVAGCATSPGYSGGGYNSGYGTAPQSARCYDCGTVVAIEQTGSNNNPNVAGPVLGGVVGAVAGREIARRTTDSEGRRNVATAAGAVGGAMAGNAIQNRTEGAGYNIHVRMEDGRTTVVHQTSLNGIRQGSYVRIQNGQARLH
jgi:outer membrane lipoprotein SlyB